MAEAQLVASVVLQELLEELVPPRGESDDELEYMKTSLLETEKTPATRISGYFENVVPNLKKIRKRRNTFVADSSHVKSYAQMKMAQCVKTKLRAG